MKDTVIMKGTEPQSQVSIVFTSPVSYVAGDNYALRSLGELMDIKLVEKLREEKGSVYGVSAYGSLSRIPYSYSSFTISFPCAPENVDSLTKAALDELRKIIETGVSAEDLEKIKEQQRRKLEVDIKQNNFWMNSLFDAYFNGYSPGEILKRQQQIEKLNSATIQNAARKYINLKNYIRAV